MKTEGRLTEVAMRMELSRGFYSWFYGLNVSHLVENKAVSYISHYVCGSIRHYLELPLVGKYCGACLVIEPVSLALYAHSMFSRAHFSNSR